MPRVQKVVRQHFLMSKWERNFDCILSSKNKFVLLFALYAVLIANEFPHRHIKVKNTAEIVQYKKVYFSSSASPPSAAAIPVKSYPSMLIILVTLMHRVKKVERQHLKTELFSMVVCFAFR